MTNKTDNPPPPSMPSKSGAIFGVLVVSVLLASSLGGLVVARMFQERRNASGPQITMARAADGRSVDQQGIPRFYSLPQFHLVDHKGGELTNQTLAQHVVIANFIFTRCGMVCPLLSRHMALLGKETDAIDPSGTKILRVSFSVDPEFDTPAVLTTYGARFDQGKTPWLFGTGKIEDVRNLIRDGFKLPLPAGAAESGGPLTHSESTVLIDRNGVIRGYYKVQEPIEKARLLLHVRQLTQPD